MSDNMKLVVLGSGTTVPHPRRAASGYWLEADGKLILLDAGADVSHRMAQERLNWPELDAVWISHFHLDHVGGLPPFLFYLKYAPQTQQRQKPLTVFGPRGTKKLLEAFDEAGDYKLFAQRFRVEVREVAPRETFDLLPGLHGETLSTPHTSESLALSLRDEDGRTLSYTSDTGYTDALIEFARNVDLLLMECSFPRDKPVEIHLELSEAMRIASEAVPRRVVLTHLYPQWDELDLVAEARKLWAGETIEARDGLRLEVASNDE